MYTREWEFYAQCSRLKTKQTKRRLQKTDQKKQLVAYYKKLMHIRKQLSKPEYRELFPPVQKGWKRFFVLRDDVARSEDALFFQQILDKINKTKYSFRKDFKKRQKQNGRKVYVESVQYLKAIELNELKKIKLTEKEQAYFRFVFAYNHPGWRKVLAFTEPWRFVLKVAPQMLTQVRVIDPELMRQEREIDNYLQQNGLDYKMYKLMHGSRGYKNNYKGHDKMKYRSLFKTETVSMLLEMENNNY